MHMRRLCLLAAACLMSVQPSWSVSEPTKLDVSWNRNWPALPGKGQPVRAIEEVKASYALAARHPEVTNYLSCYCGCGAGGHKSLTDCFVKARNGRQIVWDTMGFG